MGFREVLAKYADAIWLLDDEEQHRLFVSLVEYAEDGTMPEEQGNEKFVFAMIRKEMDDEPQKRSRSEINRENIQKRWNRKRISNTNDTNDTNCDSYKTEDTNDTKKPNTSALNTNDTNRISYTNGTQEKESLPSPLSPSLPSPEPPSNTPPIIPQPAKEKESKKRVKAADKPRHKRGQYGHVLLTDDEFERLKKDFGESEREFLIREMDEYAQLRGKKYDDWNLAIRKAQREGWFDRNRQRGQPFTGNREQRSLWETAVPFEH